MPVVTRPKKPSRQGRYRKVLMDPESLSPLAASLESVFHDLDQKRERRLITDAEFLSYGLICLLACRRPNAFQSDKSLAQTTEPFANPGAIPAARAFHPTGQPLVLSDFWEMLQRHGLPLSGYAKTLNRDISVIDFLNRTRFRGIPDSARLALLEWMKGRYPLTLFFHIPSGDEVFELQKQGGRCVSFLKQAKALTEWHHDRDAISFIVHDLIHAHEFYSRPQRARQQIGFYHWLDSIKDHAQLRKLMDESDGFAERWAYVLSDMNSYCGHLLKTLHAAFAIHARGGEGEAIWKNVVEGSGLGEKDKALFLRINSPAWGEEDFLRLESVLEGPGFQPFAPNKP